LTGVTPGGTGRRSPRQVVGLLSLVSFLNYPLRTNITIAAAAMMPDLRLSQVQMGDIFSAFQLPYALGQIPGGFLGDRYGARRVITVTVMLWAVSSLMTGAIPAGIGVGAAVLMLGAARGLLGLAQAATYPVGTSVINRFVPAAYRGRAVALFLAAAVIGSILAPVAVSQGMVRIGWRGTFLVAAGLAVLIGLIWHAGAPRREALPAEHEALGTTMGRAVRLLRDRRLLALSLSYACQSSVWFLFVYWFYIYLTDVRGFSVLSGGFFAVAPYVAAAVMGPLGGTLLDVLSRSRGKVIARRTTACIGLLGAAVCVLVGARLDNPYLAISALALSAGLINFVESPYWTTAAELGGAEAGTAGGVLNTIGNLGGVFSTSAVPRMVDAWGWIPSMLIFAGIAVTGAALWFSFRPERGPP